MEHFSIIKVHYLDASAAVKLVSDEEGSDIIKDYFSRESGFRMTQLCIAETYSALKVKFTKKLVDLDNYLRLCSLFFLHLQGKIEPDKSMVYDPRNFYGVKDFALRHALDISDAMQLFTLKEGPFRILAGESKPMLITADQKLAEAANNESLRVWNCLRERMPTA